MNDCGCDMYISAPYLQSKFTNLSPQTTMMSGDTVPAWAEIKVKVKPSLVSLLLYLVIGHIFGGIILFWRSHVSYLPSIASLLVGIENFEEVHLE